ncbi:hypothetical protein AMJ85_09145 [candidate division BRC1 bacterium SM23_51]|nr:MAG: hypothetical protein AMJ85_09145 [candidate division BRC1 bacterium SM23_51]
MNRDDYGSYGDVDLAGVTHRMRWIEPGTFMMGSPEDEPGRFEDETLHQVTLTKGFWLGETTCTQAAWKAVMSENPSHFKGDNRPVERVSWDDCQDFLKRANAIAGLRLPTEVEWEYACRAGTMTSFWFGDKIITEQVNHVCNGKGRGETVDVKALPCNAWGLYQMHGNVWEWCQDWYDDVDVEEDSGRVVRGGSWGGEPRYCRSACRNWYRSHNGFDFLSFRVARS